MRVKGAVALAIALLAAAMLIIASGMRTPTAGAHAPHPGLDFSMEADTNGDTVNDCGTGAGESTTCTAAINGAFRVREYLNSLADIPAFRAMRLHFGFGGGVASASPPDSVWPGCSTESYQQAGPPNNYIHADCVVAHDAPSVAYTGLVGQIYFVCSAGGTIDLRHAIQPQHTLVRETDALNSAHAEGADTSEVLNVTCASPRLYPVDTDGDTCPDAREAGSDKHAGGERNFFSQWDYFNPTGDHQNRIDDVIAVLHQYFIDEGNPAYNARTDRSPLGPNAWNLGPPNGEQRIDDILAAVFSYFDDCS